MFHKYLNVAHANLMNILTFCTRSLPAIYSGDLCMPTEYSTNCSRKKFALPDKNFFCNRPFYGDYKKGKYFKNRDVLVLMRNTLLMKNMLCYIFFELL